MSESATDPEVDGGVDVEDPGSFSEWRDGLSYDEDDATDLSGLDDDEPEDDDAATAEDDSQSAEAGGDDPDPPEGDAEDPGEGSEDDAEVDAAKEDEEPEGDVEAEEEAEDEGKPEELEAEASAADGSDADDDAETPGQPEVEWTAWRPKADRTELQLEGAIETAQGVWIPRDAVPTLQSHLADRSIWERERQQLQAQLRERSGAEAEAEAFSKFFKDDLFRRPVEEQIAWFENLEQNAPALIAQGEAAREKDRADSLEAANTARAAAEESETFERGAPQRLRSAVDTALGWDDFKDQGLDADEVYKDLASLGGDALFFRATEDIPEYGLTKGQYGLDFKLIVKVIERYAQRAATTKSAEAEADAITQAAKDRNANKQRGKKKGKKPPPSVSAGGAAVGAEETTPPDSLASWKDSVGLGG